MRVILLGVSILSLSTLALADENGFKEHKKHLLNEVDSQISELQSEKSCVEAAMDHESLKHCHEQLEKSRKHHKEEEFSNQIHHLQEEKAKLLQKE
jgi:hypothetical protein